jgi:hypothetical protein
VGGAQDGDCVAREREIGARVPVVAAPEELTDRFPFGSPPRDRWSPSPHRASRRRRATSTLPRTSPHQLRRVQHSMSWLSRRANSRRAYALIPRPCSKRRAAGLPHVAYRSGQEPGKKVRTLRESDCVSGQLPGLSNGNEVEGTTPRHGLREKYSCERAVGARGSSRSLEQILAVGPMEPSSRAALPPHVARHAGPHWRPGHRVLPERLRAPARAHE